MVKLFANALQLMQLGLRQRISQTKCGEVSRSFLTCFADRCGAACLVEGP